MQLLLYSYYWRSSAKDCPDSTLSQEEKIAAIDRLRFQDHQWTYNSLNCFAVALTTHKTITLTYIDIRLCSVTDLHIRLPYANKGIWTSTSTSDCWTHWSPLVGQSLSFNNPFVIQLQRRISPKDKPGRVTRCGCFLSSESYYAPSCLQLILLCSWSI